MHTQSTLNKRLCGIRLTHLLPTARWKAAVASPMVLMRHPLPRGLLTLGLPTGGHAEHWELGQALRQRYRGFLNAFLPPAGEVRLGTREGGGTGCSHLCPRGDRW